MTVSQFCSDEPWSGWKVMAAAPSACVIWENVQSGQERTGAQKTESHAAGSQHTGSMAHAGIPAGVIAGVQRGWEFTRTQVSLSSLNPLPRCKILLVTPVGRGGEERQRNIMTERSHHLGVWFEIKILPAQCMGQAGPGTDRRWAPTSGKD